MNFKRSETKKKNTQASREVLEIEVIFLGVGEKNERQSDTDF